MSDDNASEAAAREALIHPRCPALGGPVPFRHCRTSGTDQLCPRIPECWWDRPEVLGWFAAQGGSAAAPPRESRIQIMLNALGRSRTPQD
ncbi:MAG: hypothetical protein P1P84_03820 [Deferrisomatales bacterium]|nr:hypothetical protein [Deferrisomatales bacterium]